MALTPPKLGGAVPPWAKQAAPGMSAATAGPGDALLANHTAAAAPAPVDDEDEAQNVPPVDFSALFAPKPAPVPPLPAQEPDVADAMAQAVANFPMPGATAAQQDDVVDVEARTVPDSEPIAARLLEGEEHCGELAYVLRGASHKLGQLPECLYPVNGGLGEDGYKGFAVWFDADEQGLTATAFPYVYSIPEPTGKPGRPYRHRVEFTEAEPQHHTFSEATSPAEAMALLAGMYCGTAQAVVVARSVADRVVKVASHDAKAGQRHLRWVGGISLQVFDAKVV